VSEGNKPSRAANAPKKPRPGFAGRRSRAAVMLASWLVPAIMAAAYMILIVTSEVDRTGAAWEAIGFAFVLLLWWMFRLLTEHAAMARAVAVGDAERVAEIADHRLGKRFARSRTTFLVYRALAYELDGDWQAALQRLDQAKPAGAWRSIAASVRVSALAELGRASEARAVFDADVQRGAVRDAQLGLLSRLAEARLRRAEGNREAASELVEALAHNVRAGSGTRARAQAMLEELRVAKN
jgi:hypothetical protein